MERITKMDLKDFRLLNQIKENPVLSELLKKFFNQAEKGLEKYGELVDVDDLSLLEWLNHAQEELIDELVYLECIKQKVKKAHS
jgi:succinate dehydrogenase flavin-adding protein (antitoxin of CptAB toxin-antitoxin module)